MPKLPERIDDIAGLRFAAWIRESTKGQYDRYGPDSQQREITDFAERYGLVDTGLIWTPAQSGKTVWQSSEMAAMLDAARAGAFDVLLIGYFDRWQRNLRRFLELIEDGLHASGVALVMCDSRLLSSDPRDWQRMKEQANRAEDYSLDMGYKIADGYKAKWHKYDDPPGKAPLGYSREGDNSLLAIACLSP